MITKLLLKPPDSSLRLLAPDGSEIGADEHGLFDVTQWPMLALRHPDWEVIEAFSPEPASAEPAK